MTDPDDKSAMDDDALLRLVGTERAASIGLDNDAELSGAREQALNYYKGEMPDIPALEGRSRAVSTDIADAIETILPDLVEIFVGGDDVASFTPHGPEDEQGAQQETDYVHHVVFQQNDGFLTLYTAIKDALQVKVGVFKFWREDDDKEERVQLTGKTGIELQLAMLDGWEVESHQPSQTQPYQAQMQPGAPPPEPLLDAMLVKRTPCSKVRIMAVPPEDFTVARDTVALSQTTYCAMRSRPRAQELIAQGYDEEAVERLPQCPDEANSVEMARDTAGEQNASAGAVENTMRRVEVVEHYIRCLEGRDLALWRVVTGGDETILLHKEKVEAVPFAAITPYPVTHRFFGRSVADLLIQVQQIRTVLTRLMLDSGYFALNQRQEIALSKCSETTIDDYLDNRPNRPVLSTTGDALRPLASGQMGFDPFQALEYTATLGEQRTGVVRNAQGLNPDTLHDTAKGAIALMSAAQKRVRMIARVMAETGVKDLFLGVHTLLRTGPAQAAVARLRGKWVDVDPTAWGVREDMDIAIGVGAGGREHELQALQNVMMLQGNLAAHPGGAAMVTPQNVYNAAKRLIERSGLKGAESYISEPPPPPPPGTPPPPPPPNPDMMKVQAEAQLKQQQAANDAQLAKYKIDTETQLKREQMQLEADMKQKQMIMDAQVRLTAPPVRFGGHAG